MLRRNSPPAFRPVDTLPSNTSEGLSVFFRPANLAVVWEGQRWVGVDGATYIVSASAEVAVREPVVAAGGELVPCDATVHRRVDGVCVWTGDQLAAVRQQGLVRGYAGLTPGQPFVVGKSPGTLVEPPISGVLAVLVIGRAFDAETLNVNVEDPRVIVG